MAKPQPPSISSSTFPTIHHCSSTSRDDHTVVADMDGTLLRDRSSFPYFALVAYEGGGILRLLFLLLASPLAGLLYYLISESAGFACSYFQPLRCVLTANPRVMVEGFLKEYLGVDVVLGTEIGSYKGRATGLLLGPGVLVGRNKAEALQKAFSDAPDIGIGDRKTDFPFMRLCKVSHHFCCSPVAIPLVSELVSDTRGLAMFSSFKSRYIILWCGLLFQRHSIHHSNDAGGLHSTTQARSRACAPQQAAKAHSLPRWPPRPEANPSHRPPHPPLDPRRLCSLFASASPSASFSPYPSSPTPVEPSASASPSRATCLHLPRNPLASPETSSFAPTAPSSTPFFLSIALGRPIPALTYSLSRFSEFISPINTVRLSRDRATDANIIKKLLQQGDLTICPEGTTCREPFLLRFSALFAELTDELVPVAMCSKMSMFHGTTARGWKGMDLFYFFMNPNPAYEVTFLNKLPRELTCGAGKSSHDVANNIQRMIAETLAYKCTSFTRKDKYKALARNDGSAVEKPRLDANTVMGC
ncbi:glycerol-3-phosphate acyltransferase 4 [Actinidia rufa]|uniref:Glycerol-3-phosphate acyltransferase 4 n=1 Tax=Actinidia rufa TaxID=165716 RepID=A0A7J0DYI9_9ERIC|nr:glycerol-3-phosphate acyltransferase 4 [Actinidia rufa]